jgi:phage baseplate assembly protein W
MAAFDPNADSEVAYITQKGNAPSVTFSDINLGAGTISPYELVSDIDSINQNIMLIAATPKRSKIWRPEIGSNIVDYLFDPIDGQTANAIRVELLKALEENYEYRVVVVQMEVIPDVQNQSYYVDIDYRVPAIGKSIKDFQFNLNKGVA